MKFDRVEVLRALALAPVLGAIILALLATSLHAQDISRRPLEHRDYDLWNTMSQSALSPDGKWVVYGVQSGSIDGEATLHIQNLATASEYVIQRAAGVQLTADSRYAVYRITPERKLLKQLRKEKKNSAELPKPKLQILELETGAIRTVENVRSFSIPEENGNWVACLLEKPAGDGELSEKTLGSRETYEVTGEGLRRPEAPLKLKSREQLARERGELEPAEQQPQTKEEAKAEGKETEAKEVATKKDETEKKDKAAGTPLMLINLTAGTRQVFPAVVSYLFSKNGKTLAFSTSVVEEEKEPHSNSQPSDAVHVLKLDSMQHLTIAAGTGEYKNMAFTEDGSHLAFITNKDDYQVEDPSWCVYLWATNGKQAKRIVKEGEKGVPAGWWVSPN